MKASDYLHLAKVAKQEGVNTNNLIWYMNPKASRVLAFGILLLNWTSHQRTSLLAIGESGRKRLRVLRRCVRKRQKHELKNTWKCL